MNAMTKNTNPNDTTIQGSSTDEASQGNAFSILATLGKKAEPKKTPAKAEATEPAKRSEGAGIVKRTNAYFVDPGSITRREGWNPRFDMGEIEMLAKSLKANGILNPLRIKRLPAGSAFAFELLDGDRRMTAIELLAKQGFTFEGGIPVIIVDKGQDDMTSLVQMFEANSGKPFLPLEEAAAYKRMRDGDKEAGVKGMTIKQICERVGRKQVHVVATLALLDADAEVQEAVRTGEVNSTMGKQIAVHARGDKAKQQELIKQAKAAGKDKGKRREVKKNIEASRQAKAAKTGKTLKIRALDDAGLSALGAKVAATMADKMVAAGLPLESDMREWILGNPDLALAFTFGALEALKAAAGAKINLDL